MAPGSGGGRRASKEAGSQRGAGTRRGGTKRSSRARPGLPAARTGLCCERSPIPAAGGPPTTPPRERRPLARRAYAPAGVTAWPRPLGGSVARRRRAIARGRPAPDGAPGSSDTLNVSAGRRRDHARSHQEQIPRGSGRVPSSVQSLDDQRDALPSPIHIVTRPRRPPDRWSS